MAVSESSSVCRCVKGDMSVRMGARRGRYMSARGVVSILGEAIRDAGTSEWTGEGKAEGGKVDWRRGCLLLGRGVEVMFGTSNDMVMLDRARMIFNDGRRGSRGMCLPDMIEQRSYMLMTRVLEYINNR
jgi:hypothetical protein